MNEQKQAQAVAEQARHERDTLLEEKARQSQYLAALHETTMGLISRLDVNELLETLITRAEPTAGGAAWVPLSAGFRGS